jgi:dihydroxyacetone kinase-like predicted kinase
VHVDDVGAAIEAGLTAGRPHRVKVTHFAEQREQRRQREEQREREQHADGDARRRAAGRAVVIVSAGPGLSELYAEAGAVVLDGRPSTAELAKAITAAGVDEVVVLPNDVLTMRSAEAAARAVEQDLGIRVAVIPTVAQVQGLAALAVHDAGAAFDKDVLEMTATARHARHGGVTVADRRALTLAGPCEPGDHLGIIDGEFIRVGGTLEEVAVDVLGRMVGAGGELVTIVSGRDDAEGTLAEAAAQWVREHHPTVDVVTYAGGQARYPLLVAVE